MKKTERSSELLWILGITCIALGVAICSKADLGVSMVAAPAFIVSEALSPIWSGFSVGVTEYMIEGLMLAVLCLVIGRFKWRYLLSFATAVMYGYILDLFMFLLQGLTISHILERWALLLLGDAIIGFGVAAVFRTYMPVQVYEFVVSALSKRFGFNMNRVKLIFDYSLLALSVLLAITLFGDIGSFDLSAITHASFHSIGLGTLVTTLINSPIITLMGKLIDKIFVPSPRFPALERKIGNS